MANASENLQNIPDNTNSQLKSAVDFSISNNDQDLMDLMIEQKTYFAARGIPYRAGNLLDAIQAVELLPLFEEADRWIDNDEMKQARILAAEKAWDFAQTAHIENPIDPELVKDLFSRSFELTFSPELGIKSKEGPVYPTIEERIAAADELIDERMAQADKYPYYDLYKAKGVPMQYDESGMAYMELYRVIMGADSENQLAGGLRDGLFTSDELTKLPPSIRLAAVDGRPSGVESLSTESNLDLAEAYLVIDAGHDQSAYLSASEVVVGGRQTILKLRVPVCLTLPVNFLIEADAQANGRTYTGTEKEIAILGRIRPEWVVDSSADPTYVVPLAAA